MKNNYSYDMFIEKLKQIYENNKNVIKNLSNKQTDVMDIISNELYLYQKCESQDSMVRTNFYIPNIMLGRWKYDNNPSENEFLILETTSQYDPDKIKENTIILDNKFHKLKYMSLCQSHNKSFKYNLSDLNVMAETTYDSILCMEVPNMNKKVQIKISYINDKVVKISFNVDNSIKGYCKCDRCIEHNKDDRCNCDLCFSHLIHGQYDDCFCCSKNYTGENYNKHRIKAIGDKQLLKIYRSTHIHKTSQSIKQAFTKSRRNKVANNVRRYRNNLTEDEKKEIREKDVIRKREAKYGVKSKGKTKKPKSPDEKKEEARLRKQQSRQNMKNKYGDDAWNKIHAKEIQLQRLKANEDNEDKIEQLKEEIKLLKE
jgi:hypothetical protein